MSELGGGPLLALRQREGVANGQHLFIGGVVVQLIESALLVVLGVVPGSERERVALLAVRLGVPGGEGGPYVAAVVGGGETAEPIDRVSLASRPVERESTSC